MTKRFDSDRRDVTPRPELVEYESGEGQGIRSTVGGQDFGRHSVSA